MKNLEEDRNDELFEKENIRLQKAVDAAHGTLAVISNYANNELSVFEMIRIAKEWLKEYIV